MIPSFSRLYLRSLSYSMLFCIINLSNQSLMSLVSKSKNTVPSDKPHPLPQPDILSSGLLAHKYDFPRAKLESSSSMKKLDFLRMKNESQHQSKNKLTITPQKNHEFRGMAQDRSTTPEPCFGLNTTYSQSPSTQICIKPLVKPEENSFKQEKSILMQNLVDQSKLIESLQAQVEESQNSLVRCEQENKRLKEHCHRLGDENKQLYAQVDEMIKDIDYIRENYDKKENECSQMKIQMLGLNEELKQAQSERSKQIQHQKEISQLQQTIQDYVAKLQQRDSDFENLQIQFESLKQELQQSKPFQSNLSSRRQSNQSELIFYQAQLEQKEKEKQICEDKLVEMQTKIHVLQENKSTCAAQSNQSSQLNKEVNKMKQLIQIQKRQIESQQKTIMNQHFEIQNLQTLLYNSTDQDSQFRKSYCSNELEVNSIQTSQKQDDLQMYHIKDTEMSLKLNYENLKNGSPQQSFQKCAIAFVQEDTFRNLESIDS